VPYGASVSDWAAWKALGIISELLPVVSDPTARRSELSNIKDAGKVPSRFNGAGEMVGIPKWPTLKSTDAQVDRWAQDPRLGICCQARRVKAFDIDIADPVVAGDIADVLELVLGPMPTRGRSNSGKRLLAFRLAADFPKRVIKTAHGNIELLSTGQQFIVCGTHPSGVRYEWRDGTPPEIPVLTMEEVDAAWQALIDAYALPDGASEAREGAAPSAARRAVDAQDPTVAWLDANGWVTGYERDGKVNVRCPWEAEHTSDTGPSSTTYFPAGVGGFETGHFKCLHAHCASRAGDFLAAIGYVAADFDVVTLDAVEDAAAAIARARNAERDARARLEDFYAYLPDHKYIYRPTRAMWPAASVDGTVRPWPKSPADAKKSIAPSKLLDLTRAVQQMTWLPGAPEIIADRVMQPIGWIERPGTRVFNRYVAPPKFVGDPALAGPWLDHLRTVYPTDWEHLLRWFAQRLQHPGVKVNHALVLGGDQGIGKDSILVPVKAGVGASNCEDVSPGALMGSFNSFAASVLLVVSEARDLGDADRFKLYDHSKTYISAPPDVLRVNEKHLREYYVPNLCGIVITTNHRTSGLYLPADDRRHFVAWSEAKREQFGADYFQALYRWYAEGGVGHVVAYLHRVDLSDFDPKAAPLKTPAFWAMVAAGEAPESSELRDLIQALGSPDALTIGELIAAAQSSGLHELAHEMADRKSRTRLPHMLDRVGYAAVRSPDSKDGRFGKFSIYSKQGLGLGEQVRAARALEAALRKRAKPIAGGDGAAALDFA
jgi:hypothetical protein